MLNSRKRLLILMAVLSILIIGAAAVEYYIMNGQTIARGVYIGNLNVSRMERDQLAQAIIPLYQKSLEREIVINGGGKSWSFSPVQLGLKEDREKTIKEAWEVGRKGPFWERWYIRWKTMKHPCHIPLAFDVEESDLTNYTKEMAQMIDKEAENAGIFIKSNHQVEIVPGENGVKVEIDSSVNVIKEVLQSGDDSECTLIIQVIKPVLTEEVVKSWQINGAVSSFETWFDPAKVDRSENIKVALMALNHVLVMPQEVFSFNEVVGPRTTEAGYKESLVIENNEFTPGIGGGVCQVSTTLYNAILLASLPIVERQPHSLPISYVKPGMDATVSFGWADLKFINDRQKPILLHTEYQKGKIKVLVFATKGEFPEVKLSSKIIEYLEADEEIIKDPTLAPGQTLVEEKGQRGMIVEVYRETVSEGKVISSELISRDKYQPQKAVIRVPAAN
ncbi:MAG: VanW family protein [Dehalobacterium sp.]